MQLNSWSVKRLKRRLAEPYIGSSHLYGLLVKKVRRYVTSEVQQASLTS